MADAPAERRLAAILATDVAGYSRLLNLFEAETVAAWRAARTEVIDPAIAEFGGRIVKHTGDGFLAEFGTIVDAVRAAVHMQGIFAVRNADVPEDRRMEFRMGINLGDIYVDDDDIHGDGVNIAARLEGLANSGGICVTANVHDQVHRKLELKFEDLGEQDLKNIADSVRVYRIDLGEKSTAAPARPATPATQDKPSIAVLPFDNLSGDQEQEYFSDGITEDIITALSRIRRILVIARNSTFAYKGKSPDLRDVAKELGVTYVLEGSVRKAGGRVRITAQLIDGETGGHVWAEKYDRDLEDIFAVQDEITETVVGTIEPELARAERERAKLKRPEKLDAWDMYHRGMAALYMRTKDEIAAARETFQKASEMDPHFSAAFVGEAFTHFFDVLFGFSEGPPESIGAGLKAAARAVALDADDASARSAHGYMLMLSHQADAAIPEFEAVIGLNPSSSDAHFGLGACIMCCGDAQGSFAHYQTAMRLSPRDPFLVGILGRTAEAHLFLGEHDAAVEWARKALSQPHAQWPEHAPLVAALGHLGKAEEAERALDGLLAAAPFFFPRLHAADDNDNPCRLPGSLPGWTSRRRRPRINAGTGAVKESRAFSAYGAPPIE